LNNQSLKTILKYSSGYSDDHLLKLIAGNDEQAFEELFDRYWESAHTLAYSKLRSKEITEEIVHDIFLNFWLRRHSLDIKNFSHYLHVSVKYKAITYINKQLSQKKYFEDYKDLEKFEEDETLRTVEYNDLMKALEEGVRVLPEKTQEVFRLNRLEGRTVSEIANLLNLSEKAIEYHITRSRKELRLYLKDFLVLLCISAPFLLR
jgi:RNA polymerase sigma-70 factor (family 1)